MDFTLHTNEQVENLAMVLDNRSGLERLTLVLDRMGASLANAIIKNHGSTLNHLEFIKMSESSRFMPHILDIVGPCGELKYMGTKGVKYSHRYRHMVKRLWEKRWLEERVMERCASSMFCPIFRGSVEYPFVVILSAFPVTYVGSLSPFSSLKGLAN